MKFLNTTKFLKFLFFYLFFWANCSDTNNISLTPTPTFTPSATLTPAATPVSSGNIYYVSPSGKDSNPGTITEPWATPGYASKQLQPGDTLIIMDGEYIMSTFYDDMITPLVDGTSTKWITIKGEDGARPLLRGKSSLLAVVDISGRSYIKIENLKITSEIDTPYSGGLREGIEAGGSGGGNVSNIIIKNVEIYDVEEAGINLSGNTQNITMDSLNIHHTGMGGISAPSAEGGKGWENVALKNSYIRYAGYFYQGKEQISPYDRPDGIGMEAGEGPLEISNCTFEHNRGDGVDSKLKNTYVHNTIIANNSADSLKLWGPNSKVENVLIYGDGDGNAQNGPWASIVINTELSGNFEFINVTVDENSSRENYPILIQYDSSTPITVLMRNCIVAHGYSEIYMGNSVMATFDHNLFYRSGEPDEPVLHFNGNDYLPSQLNALGEGNISEEPLFVKRAWGSSGDYHLKINSPAINSGTAKGAPTIDLEGNTRPQGSGYDIGAYEHI